MCTPRTAINLVKRYVFALIAGLAGVSTYGNEVMAWEEARVTMARYCYECHGGFLTEGNVDLLAKRSEETLADDPQFWETVVAALRNHYMPSEDGRPMPPESRAALIQAIDQRMIVMTEQENPPTASLRRLNRNQLANTLKTLFFIDWDIAKDLPPDDSGYGFDTTADVLGVSPLLLEKYLELAAEAGYYACPSPAEKQSIRLSGSAMQGGNVFSDHFRIVYASGLDHAAYFESELQAGLYSIELGLAAQQAGPEPARAALWINNQKVDEFIVNSASHEEPDTLQSRFRVHPFNKADKDDPHAVPIFQSPIKVSITLENDYYRKGEGDAAPEDRNLFITRISYTGPEQSEQDLKTKFLDYYFGGNLESLSEDKIRSGIFRFSSHAYRKPVEKDFLNSLWAVYKGNLTGASPDRRAAMRAVIDAVFTSPRFLFRYEPDEPDNSFALASWLAYFLWSSPPDARLFELAQTGELYNQLDSEIMRMLKDPKARSLTDDFAAQWLQFRDMRSHWASKKAYPDFDGSIKWAMREETNRFVRDIVENDRSLLRILDADYTFANKRLAEYYGLKDIPKRGYKKVSLEGTPRRGIWSQGTTLTVTSHANRTSPVLRGKWILENLLGMSPPPPPPNVPSLKETGDAPKPHSLRESLAMHRDNPDCRSCHAIMDPFGLALETYNGVGQWRSEEALVEVQPETLFDGETIESPVDLAHYLVEKHREDFIRNAAVKMTIYATGRGVTWRDRASINRIVKKAESNDYRFSEFVKAIIYEYAPGIEHLPKGEEMVYLPTPSEES